MAIILRVTTGAAAGTAIPIGDGLVIGREVPPPGDLMGDQTISRRHAQFRPLGEDGALIEDLGSVNPTQVNGQRLSGPTALKVGDRIQVGETTLTVEQVGAPVAPSTVAAPQTPRARETIIESVAPVAAGQPLGAASSGGSGGLPAPAWQQPATSGSRSGGSKRTLAVVGVVAVVAAAFGGGFATGHSSKKASPAASAAGASVSPAAAAYNLCVPADAGRSGPGHFRFNTSACENGTTTVTAFTLPIHKGTSNGQTVWYVIMDTSDQSTSARLGVNYAPKLANAKATKGVQKVTVAADGTVNFPGTVDFNHNRVLVPGPTGFPPAAGAQPPSVGDALYSPLIELPNGIVENAPQIANASGKADKVISLDTSAMKVVFRAQHGFYENKPVHYASFDASDPTVAAIEDVTYAPNLNAVPGPNNESMTTSAREMLIAFLNGPASGPLGQGVNFALLTGGANPTPLNLLHEAPVLPNHADVGSTLYTPMWDVHFAVWTQAAIDAGDQTQYRDVDTVLNVVHPAPGNGPALITGPDGKAFGAAGVIVNCPLVSIDLP
jgi:hypothetical protein